MALILRGNGVVEGLTDLPAGSVTAADLASGAITSSALPTGSVLQVLQSVKTDNFTTSSTSFIDVTGLSVSITPSSTSNKILVMTDIAVGNAAGAYCMFNIVRDSTNLYQGTETKTYVASRVEYFNSTSFIGTVHMCYLDSPSTTSSTTYKLQMKVSSATGAINRRVSPDDTSLASSITVMEVAG